MSKKVLVLEDEENIRSFVVFNLKKSDYETVEFDKGSDAIQYMQDHSDVSIAILDVMLPDVSGFDVCRKIRATGKRTGIIMLTALSQESDRVTGLMTGADDYVTKPFSVAELVARVDALYRRMNGAGFDDNRITVGDFTLDMRSRELLRSGERIDLTQVEYLIIKAFFDNRGKALSREEIVTLVWGKDYHDDLKVVDVNIRRLRLKIEKNAAMPDHIVTVWGYGYKWEE
ncbi:MAG: response regulator transcription factor [Clostridia bacterium]|nr:response regulator transcription factor [Clostridia bacterium]